MSSDLSPEVASQIVSSAEEYFGGENILLIQFSAENTSLTKLFLSGGRYAYLDRSGDLVDQWQLNGRPEELLYDLHHRLLLGDTGLLLSGIAAIVLLALFIPGAIVWWPARRSFSWRLLVGGLMRPQLLATHRNLGIVSLAPIALLLVTAVILSFPDQAQAIFVDPHSSKDSYSDLYVQNLDQLSGEQYGSIEKSLERALLSMQGGRIRSLQLPYGYSGYNLIGMQQKGDWHSGGLSRIYIDPQTGLMDMRLDAHSLPRSEKLYNLSYPLHTGKVDSLVYRIALTVFGASLFSLSLIGSVSFIKKLWANLKT